VNPQYILVAAVILFMGWFAIGVVYNLRRGEALLKWMQGGLPSIGQKTTFRWLGTSVAELVIAHAKKPFRRLETLLVLKPRDVRDAMISSSSGLSLQRLLSWTSSLWIRSLGAGAAS
jgi:hypothetical protein